MVSCVQREFGSSEACRGGFDVIMVRNFSTGFLHAEPAFVGNELL